MMKKLKATLLLILVLFSSLVHSQYNYQIVDTTKSWNTLQIGYGSMMIPICGGTRTNIFHDEVSSGGYTCLMVWETTDSSNYNWYDVGYIREDTLTQQVFYGFSQEGLIYDFSLQVGDSLTIDNDYIQAYNILLVCVNIDTVVINGDLKKRYFLHAPALNPYIADIWIEGVGSKWGILNSGFGGVASAGGEPKLLCCKENETLLYMDTMFNTCYIAEFYPKIVSEYYDTAYAGLPYSFQIQLSDTENIDSISFLGEYIPENFTFDESTGILTGQPEIAGSYDCMISVVNNDIHFITDRLGGHIVVMLPAEVSKHQKESDIKIYPNPVVETINVTTSLNKDAMCTLEIINSSGLVLEKRSIGKGLTELDFSRYNKGIFLLRFTSATGSLLKTEKIVK